MMARLEVKQKIDGKWKLIPLKHVAGKTLGEVLHEWEDNEVVMKVEHEGKTVGMVCGTPYWVERYRSMGHKTFSFGEAFAMMERSDKAELLDDLVAPEYVDDIFGGEFLQYEFPATEGFFRDEVTI